MSKKAGELFGGLPVSRIFAGNQIILGMQQKNETHGYAVGVQELEHFHARLDRFNAPTERISDPIPVLFQSGYLTLKSYNPLERKYELGFPNGEVREGFATSLYKYYMVDYVGSQDTLVNAFNDLRFNRRTIEDYRIVQVK